MSFKKFGTISLLLPLLVLSFFALSPNIALALSSDKDILTFDFASPATTGVVGAGTVTLDVPFGTDVTALVPTITISALATISPLDGVAQDFTAPVTYTVTAEDASTQAYTVTVNVASDPDIALVSADKTALVDGTIQGSNPDLSNVTVALTNPLPASGANGSAITWASDKPAVLSNDGQTIVRPAIGNPNETVTLTATLTKGSATQTKDFTIIVLAIPDPDIALLAADKASLVDGMIQGLNADLLHIIDVLTNPLPSTGSINGSAITWLSSDPTVVSNDGQTVIRPDLGNPNATLNLTATLTKGVQSDTKIFPLTVLAYTAPTLAPVSIASNNTNPIYAKTADIITLSFTADRALTGLPIVTIAGNPAMVTNTGGDSYQATYTMAGSETEASVPFTIDFTDTFGHSGITVTSTTDGSSVLYDKTRPGTIDGGSMTINSDAIYTNSSTVTLNIDLPTDLGSGLATAKYSNGGPYDPVEAPTIAKTWVLSTSAGDGTKTVYTRFYDSAGNMSSPALSHSIILDTTAPTIGIITIDPIHTSGSNYITNLSNLSATVSDGLSLIDTTTCEYTLDGSTWVPATYSLGSCVASAIDTSSATSINFRIKDMAGNTGTGVAKAVIVDVVGPVINSITITPSYLNGSTYLTDSSDLSANITDAGSGVKTCEYTVDNGANWLAGTYDESSHICSAGTVDTSSATDINFRATDNLDNVGTGTAVSSLVQDNVGPVPGTFSITPSYFDGVKTYIKASSDLSIPVADAGAGLRNCGFGYRDATTNHWLPFDATISGGNCVLTGMDTSDPLITKVILQTYDHLSFQTTATIDVELDVTAPTTIATMIDSSADTYTSDTWTNKDVTVTLNSIDTGSGVAGTQYAINGGAYGPYTVPLNFTAEGTYSINFYSTDNLGNNESAELVVVKINKTKPVITLTGNAEVTLDYGATYNDAGATALDDVDGDITASTTINNPVNTNNPGTYYVKYDVTDTAGNLADQVSRKVIVNSAPNQSGGYINGYGPKIGKVLGEKTTKAKELAKQRELKRLQAQLKALQQKLKDGKKPKLKIIQKPVVQADEEPATITPVKEELKPTSTATTTPKKPFWKFW